MNWLLVALECAAFAKIACGLNSPRTRRDKWACLEQCVCACVCVWTNTIENATKSAAGGHTVAYRDTQTFLYGKSLACNRSNIICHHLGLLASLSCSILPGMFFFHHPLRRSLFSWWLAHLPRHWTETQPQLLCPSNVLARFLCLQLDEEVNLNIAVWSPCLLVSSNVGYAWCTSQVENYQSFE